MGEEAARRRDGCEEGVRMNNDFVECAVCSRKPGSPVLCESCIANRNAIGRLLLQRRHGLVTEGKFRVYFNRHGAEPLMWCVSPEGSYWEIAVKHVRILSTSKTVFQKKETPDEDDGKPSAWIATEGVLEIDHLGFATIGEP